VLADVVGVERPAIDHLPAMRIDELDALACPEAQGLAVAGWNGLSCWHARPQESPPTLLPGGSKLNGYLADCEDEGLIMSNDDAPVAAGHGRRLLLRRTRSSPCPFELT
jgi:hypothetical protein